jgi:hypothetical protein
MDRILRGIMRYRYGSRLDMVKEFQKVRDRPEVCNLIVIRHKLDQNQRILGPQIKIANLLPPTRRVYIPFIIRFNLKFFEYSRIYLIDKLFYIFNLKFGLEIIFSLKIYS